MRYAVVIEKADNNYAAYVPDLSGCVATSATVEEVEREIIQQSDFTSMASARITCGSRSRRRFASTSRSK